MRALLSVQPGDATLLELREVPKPVPAAAEVRIRVSACSLNYPDVLIIEDRYQFRPDRPFAPGAEIAGIVDAVGPDVTRFAVGDRVIGVGFFGGLAEFTTLPADRCFSLPDNCSMVDGAALLMGHGTAHHALKDRGALQPGETLLVLGAAGGVGLAAVELGKIMGARVIAAVSSEEKAAAARQQGADAVIVYTADMSAKDSARAFGADIRAVAVGTVDLVFDPVGGPYAEPALRSLGWNGRYLVIGFPAGIPNIPLNLPLLKGCSIVGVFWGAFADRYPDAHRANAAALLELLSQQRIRPQISGTYRLDDAAAAIAELAARQTIGKLVITLD